MEWGQVSLKLGRGVGGDGAQRTFLKETASWLAFKEQTDTHVGSSG